MSPERNSIAIVTQYYKPEIGAPQNRLYEMAVGLKEFGWDVSIITAMPNYPHGRIFKGYRNSLFKKEILDGLEIRRYWIYASNSKKSLPRIFSMLSFSLLVLFSLRYLKRNAFDYIILETPPLLLGLSGYWLSRRSKAKLILNVSDLWPLSARELGAISDGFIYKRLESIEHFLYNKSFVSLGQSQEIVDYLGLHGAERPYLFRNGVDPRRFTANHSKSTHKPLKIVYTGLLGVAQGILDICRNINFKELGTEFHIYGAGSERKELEDFLRNNLDREIYYHGTAPRDEIPGILRGYSVTLISLVKNIYGAVPSKIYESMAAGLPILYSGEGEANAIIEEHNLGWTSPAKDYSALKANIMGLHSVENGIGEVRANCLNAANQLFNRPKQIEELHRYFMSLNNKNS